MRFNGDEIEFGFAPPGIAMKYNIFGPNDLQRNIGLKPRSLFLLVFFFQLTETIDYEIPFPRVNFR